MGVFEVRSLYDNFLFQHIDSLQKEGNATAIRQIIDDYKHTPYLTAAARTHLDDLEYLSEKADFELLKPAIVNSESLSLLKDFLCTHHYKEFRDQANALRNPFVLQAILATPTSVKYYNQGRLIKSVELSESGNRICHIHTILFEKEFDPVRWRTADFGVVIPSAVLFRHTYWPYMPEVPRSCCIPWFLSVVPACCRC